jgi:hypothetical protein
MSVKYGFTEEQEKSIAYGQIVGLESILATLIQNSYIRKDVYLSTHMEIIDRMIHDVYHHLLAKMEEE